MFGLDVCASGNGYTANALIYLRASRSAQADGSNRNVKPPIVDVYNVYRFYAICVLLTAKKKAFVSWGIGKGILVKFKQISVLLI